MKIAISSIVLLFSTTALLAQTIKLTGKVTGAARPAVKEIQIFADGRMQSFPVGKEEGTFQGELKLKEPQFLEIKSGGSVPDFIYAVPGESLELIIDRPNLVNRKLEIGEGRIKKLKGIMDRFYSALNDNGINPQERDWVKELFANPAPAAKVIDATLAEIQSQEAFVLEFAPQFKADFQLFAQAFNRYIALDELPLPEIETALEALSKSDLKITALTIPFFREYLVDLANAYASRKLESYDLELEYLKEGYKAQHIAAEACVKYIPNQSVVNFLFFDKINRELIVNGLKHPKYIDFLFAHAGKVITDQFADKVKQLKANQSGSEKKDRVDAFDFTLQDMEGKTYRLADFKGKLLFIDFWASWCAPCKVQIPYIKELEKHYAGKDIVFASVSLDVGKPAWIKAAKEEDLHGTVLHAEGAFKNPFPVAYGIQSIPRFMLIDANGKLISDNMPRPQDKKGVMAIIDADLYAAELEKVLNSHLEALGAESLRSGNGYHVKGKQTIPGFSTALELWYNFPKSLRSEYQIEETPSMAMVLGPDFFKKRQMVITQDTVFGTEKALLKASKSWKGKLPGLDLFLLKEVEHISLDFAPENSTNTDNQYVIQATFLGNTEKYFIDKTDFLIKKVVITSILDPRSGGGFLEATTKYEDYRNINGLAIPHLVNMNNMITLKIAEAQVGPIDRATYRNLNE
ncbi:MAG: TlpA family protein disulfide reductase [Saprospiraceae bacterium]|nr:TlpA family protein disulfide reductase [Saprospiraceae bacterium]